MQHSTILCRVAVVVAEACVSVVLLKAMWNVRYMPTGRAQVPVTLLENWLSWPFWCVCGEQLPQERLSHQPLLLYLHSIFFGTWHLPHNIHTPSKLWSCNRSNHDTCGSFSFFLGNRTPLLVTLGVGATVLLIILLLVLFIVSALRVLKMRECRYVITLECCAIMWCNLWYPSHADPWICTMFQKWFRYVWYVTGS